MRRGYAGIPVTLSCVLRLARLLTTPVAFCKYYRELLVGRNVFFSPCGVLLVFPTVAMWCAACPSTCFLQLKVNGRASKI